MRYLLDTSALSEPMSAKPDATVVRWLDQREEDSLYVSVLTLGEIQKGVARLSDGRRKNRLRDWIDEEIPRRFEGRVLGIDLEIATEWGRMQARAEDAGTPLPAVDSLLAATARVHHLIVVTRNVRDLGRCGVEVFDPWSAANA